MTTVLVGSHVPRRNAVNEAALRGADVVQIHVSAPRNWAAPQPRDDDAGLAASNIPVFVHAPYLINPVTANPDLHAKSRACLTAEADAAARVGAAGLVVHAGHLTRGADLDATTAWVGFLDGLELPVRLLIENTAGGSGPGRTADDLTRVVDALRGCGHDVGVTFDTCHAWAAGQDPVDMVARLAGRVGVDLVHANNSRDRHGSGRDRHANFDDGTIPADVLAAAVAAAHAPCAVVETPGGHLRQAADIAWLRDHPG